MKIEKPKVKIDNKNLNEDQETMILVNEVFNKYEPGKKLLAKLKNLYVSDKYCAVVFPVNVPAILQQFGTVEVYTGYRSGQASVIFGIERLLDEYKHIDDKQDDKQ